MQTTVQNFKPGLWTLFRIWAIIGLQSFGGGSSTIFLIQNEFIEKHRWMTMDEYLLLWNLCLFAPGVNLVALTILIGRKLGGFWGVVMSLAGMLLPSGAITCLLTVGFVEIRRLTAVQAILRGVVPATAGIMLLVAVRFAWPLFTAARKEGLWSMGVSVLLTISCAVALILFKLSVIVILPGAAIVGLICLTSWHHAPATPEQTIGESMTSDD